VGTGGSGSRRAGRRAVLPGSGERQSIIARGDLERPQPSAMRTARFAMLLLGATVCVVAAAGSGPQQIIYSRVFPQGGQLGLFIAAADGSGERPLLSPVNVDYDATWAPDGKSIVLTSERDGSADLYRIHPDGSGLERLTDSPAYDDQAAFAP